MTMNEQLKLTGIVITAKSGGFTGYFAEFPEAIAEGNSEKEVQQNMLNALAIILDFRRSESYENQSNQISSNFNINLELA
jgi:predicted RNase H-like HicB family nuclease